MQIYGMRRPGGVVRHIVLLGRPVPKYSQAVALCGVAVATMDLADTVGQTCRNCLRHPKFNLQAAEEVRGGG